jgi:hypothetical protein
LWKRQAATSPQALADILRTPAVLDAVRKEIRRQSSFNADVEELGRILRSGVIRAELVIDGKK